MTLVSSFNNTQRMFFDLEREECEMLEGAWAVFVGTVRRER